jgi:hypothetical protein
MSKTTDSAWLAGLLDGATTVINMDSQNITVRSVNVAALTHASDILASNGIKHSLMGLPKRGDAPKLWNIAIGRDSFQKTLDLCEKYMSR